jgi:hypothetical protein
MKLDDLGTSLAKIDTGGTKVGVKVYAVTRSQGLLRKLDIEASALQGIKTMFVKEIADKITKNDNLTLLDLSAADERKDAIYRLNVAIPDDLKCLEEVTQKDDWPLLDIKSNKLTEIKALIVEIGNSDFQVSLYKTMSPVNVLLPTSSFSLIAHDTRLQMLKDEIVRITPNFQMMRVDGEIIVMNLEALEKSFGYQEVIKREAALGVAQIVKLGLIEDSESLDALVQNVRLARKIVRIANDSPVLKLKIANDVIIKFCQKFPKLKGKIKFNAKNDKIVLKTQKSKELFLKLLMDDFLTSELTSLHYESLAKDGVEDGDDVTA